MADARPKQISKCKVHGTIRSRPSRCCLARRLRTTSVSDVLCWAISCVTVARRMKKKRSHSTDHRQLLRWATTKRINCHLLRTHPRQHDDARHVLRATTSTTLMEPLETITLECNTSKTPNMFHPYLKVTFTARAQTHMKQIRTYVSCNSKVLPQTRTRRNRGKNTPPETKEKTTSHKTASIRMQRSQCPMTSQIMHIHN